MARTFTFEEAQLPQKERTFSFEDAFAEEEKPEGGFIPALKSGVSGVKEAAAALAGRTGIVDEEDARKYIEEQKRYQAKTFAPTEEGWTEAPLTKVSELLGGSIPYMAAPIVGALAAKTLPVTGTAALVAGLGGAGVASGAQFTGTNLLRQMETGKSIGQTDLGDAALAAVPQAALDTLSLRMMPFIRGVFGATGKELTEEAAQQIASKNLKDIAADYALTTGKVMTIEGLTEATQQSLERLQAGLSITDADARDEYLESFIGGAVLGGVLAPPGRYLERRAEQKKQAQPEETPTETPTGTPAETAPTETPPAATPTVTSVTPPGEYVNEADKTITRVVPTPEGGFQVLMVDTETGQTQDGGTFGTFDEANDVAAQIAGVTPTVTNVTVPPPVTPPPPPVTPTGVSVTPPTPPTPPAGTGTPPTPPTGTPGGTPPTIKPPEFTPEEQEALKNYYVGEIPNADTIFQNRDRSGKGSVAQMQKIAGAPDYSLVGPSKVLAEGAPVVISDFEIQNNRLLGRMDTATASNGQRFPVQYAVIPAAELTTSNLADGTVNPVYADMATPHIRVVAGNGRVAGIQEAYRRKTAEQYAKELMSDPSHGVDPQEIANVPNPVLVRILPKSLVPANIGDLSNVSGIAGLEPIDRAKNDLKRLSGKFDITGLEFTEEGMPQLSTIKQFVQAMPDSEQSELINKATGLPTPEASTRLMNAIFYGAYENDALIDLYAATTNPDAKMYLNSLAKVAPKMVKLMGTGDYDIRPKIVEAIENMVSAIRQGVPIKEMPTFVQQGAIGLDPYAQKVMEFIAESGRSSKRIAEGLSRLADSALAASQVSQEPDMFGQVPPRPTLDNVFEALRGVESEPDLFGGETPPPTPPKPPTVTPTPPAPPKEVKFEIDKTPQQIAEDLKKLDIPGLAKWAVDNAPNEIAKEIASKIQSRIKDFESRNIKMVGPIVLNNTRRVRGYSGKVSYRLNRYGLEFTYRLNGLDNGQAAYGHGLTYETILHELIHAATFVQTVGLKKSDPRIQDLENLRQEIRSQFKKDLTAKKFDEQKDKDLLFYIRYMLSDIDELMANGLSSGDLQKYLKGIQVSKNFTAFGKLVDIARRVLGLPPNTQSALEVLASTTDQLISSPIEQLDKDLQDRGITRIARKSKVSKQDEITVHLAQPQADLFGADAETLKDLDENLPKAKKKLPPGRSPELAALAELLKEGKVTKEEYDQAVNRFRPIPLYTEPLTPATEEQVVNALSSDKKPKANVSIPDGTKVGLRLDIPAWNNHKTFVVSIHEGRPKTTSAKPGLAIGYRSVAMAKNVTFALGNQAKALDIAAGAAKDALQTMEGEYVNVSPSAAFEMAQKAIKDPRYVQLGFDPTRHAYFYDRRTTLPVVKADEVIQIGNMILARGVEYGSKENFLYNIDAAPQITEQESTMIPSLTRDEIIAQYAALRARRSRLVRDVIEGGATVDLQRQLTAIDDISKELKSEIEAGYAPSTSPENFLRRALEAYDKGDLSADVLASIQAAYNKTPWLLNGLRLSVRTPKQEGRSSGNFNPFQRLVTLWNGTSGVQDPAVVRHEIMHSLEQMMTEPQRKVVIDAWQDALTKAVKTNKDQQSQEYFKKVFAFLDTPSKETFASAVQAMPSYEFYQYLNPSEYWAINAEKLMASKLGGGWDRFVKAVKKYFEGLKNVFGFNNKYAVHKVFDQLMRDEPKSMGTQSLTDYVADTGARPVPLDNIATNVFGQPVPKGSWGAPTESKMDNVIYTLQDKLIDTKRVVESIKTSGKGIADRWNPYLQEELFHGRTAKQTQDFLKNELEPLMVDMAKRGLTMAQVEEYLHNRHAQSRNEFNAKRDPKMPDGGSGIMTADAKKYLASLTPEQKKNFEAIAKRIDYMVAATQQILVDTGQETQQTIDAWNKALKDYVPLQREEVDYDVKNVGVGVGSGIAVKGPFSRAAVGSSKQVIDILANLAMQRERAIVRGEKMRVGKALYGLVASNPNPGFWLAFDPEAVKDPAKAAAELGALGLNPADIQNIIDEPVVRRIDPATNQVVERPNALLINSKTSVPVRINGKEKYVIFNAKDDRAKRMAEALQNLDADQLGRVMGGIQQFTQYFAKINTQYNPIFGVINFLRDVQGALIQVSTTPLKNDRSKILAGAAPALRGIYSAERNRRANKAPQANSWGQLWEDFQQEGGQTGFRDQFSRSQERADALQAILDPSSWAKSPLGKVFTAGGTLKVPMEIARKTAAPLFNWLSDYNQAMENAIRLSAYKTGLDKGLTKQQAASIAKNLTVNFNRKGQIGKQAGALYAFFNASVQGTARMAGTLFKYDGKGYTMTGIGKAVIGGGLVLGSAQAALLAMMGFDEDEPPDFVKERNFIIPTGKDTYITVPMPLGYNVIPNTSRILTEWMLSGFKDTPKRIVDLTGAFLEMFNPLGNAGWSFQTLAPTIADPIVALSENKDWTGKPIAKKDMSSLDPTPGYTRAKEMASAMSKELSYYLNLASGGTKDSPGVVSPTPDQIDYLVGQLTGGVGRELLKAEQFATSRFTGEELPIYKVPLVGRFAGETTGVTAERNRFYSNLIELNKHEREIKGRIERKEPARDYIMEHPEARLYSYANQVERNIRTLKKRRDELIEKGAPKEKVKTIENQMMVQMKRFNDKVKEAQQ